MQVKLLRLSDVCHINKGKRETAVEGGAYEAYGAGAKATKRTNQTNTKVPCIRVTARATIGESYLHTTAFWAEESCVILRPKEALSMTYLYHWLKKNKALIAGLKKGETIPNLDLERFRNLPFELPDRAYQEEVSRFLALLERDILRLQTQTELIKKQEKTVREGLIDF